MKASDIIKMTKPGTEWLVEMRGPDPTTEGDAVCGLFHSKSQSEAESFYLLACRIIDYAMQRREGR